MVKMVEPDDIEFDDTENDCGACNGTGSCQNCSGEDEECHDCEGSGDCNECDGTGTES